MQNQFPIGKPARLSAGHLSLRVVSLGAIATCVGLLAQAQKPDTDTLQAMQRRDLFQASTTLLNKSGHARRVQVAAHRWEVVGRRQVAAFPEHGFLIVQLTGGRATTTIQGQQVRRHPGEFWIVPANATMTVDVTAETATLEVANVGGL
jgi:mannose-6-phosphate isomerase class I